MSVTLWKFHKFRRFFNLKAPQFGNSKSYPCIVGCPDNLARCPWGYPLAIANIRINLLDHIGLL